MMALTPATNVHSITNHYYALLTMRRTREKRFMNSSVL